MLGADRKAEIEYVSIVGRIDFDTNLRGREFFNLDSSLSDGLSILAGGFQLQDPFPAWLLGINIKRVVSNNSGGIGKQGILCMHPFTRIYQLRHHRERMGRNPCAIADYPLKENLLAMAVNSAIAPHIGFVFIIGKIRRSIE